MLAQEFRCQPHQVVQATSSLQCGGCRYHAHDDEHHVERDVAGFQSEDEDENEHAHHTVDTQSDASHPCTDEDQCQYDKQLDDN